METFEQNKTQFLELESNFKKNKFHEKMVKCPMCDICFSGTIQTLKMHLKFVHNKKIEINKSDIFVVNNGPKSEKTNQDNFANNMNATKSKACSMKNHQRSKFPKKVQCSSKEAEDDENNKKKRIWLTLEAKLEIIKMHEEGSLIAKIAQEKFMAESSIRCILNRKTQIHQQAMNSGNHSTKVMTRYSDGLVNQVHLFSFG